MLRRLVLVLAVTVAGLGAAAPAASHIDPDPKRAQAGSRLTVGFTVEHGCDGSPTVQLDMRLPDGLTDAVAEPVTNVPSAPTAGARTGHPPPRASAAAWRASRSSASISQWSTTQSGVATSSAMPVLTTTILPMSIR